MKRICTYLFTALIFAALLTSCGTTKEAEKAQSERVDETAPDLEDNKDKSEAVDENLPKDDEIKGEEVIEQGGTPVSEDTAAERAQEEASEESEAEGVKNEPPAVHSGDYPNMAKEDREGGKTDGSESSAKGADAKESKVPREEAAGKGSAQASKEAKLKEKKVAVAKKEEDIVVVDNLPNIVQENETVLFSSDWDEESLSDPEDCGYFYTTDNLGEFTMIKGEFRKLGGYEGSTVGFVFGFSPTKDGWLKDYIRFEINTRGEYGIYSFDGKKYTDLAKANKPDTAYLYESAAINAGYNRKNTLTIVKEKDGTYTLSINDTVVATKVPPLKKGTKGVMAFFSVGKEDQENFPDNPVTVVYRIPESKK